ncbi:MAG: protein kinase [Planctomycetota bacterium]
MVVPFLAQDDIEFAARFELAPLGPDDDPHSTTQTGKDKQTGQAVRVRRSCAIKTSNGISLVYELAFCSRVNHRGAPKVLRTTVNADGLTGVFSLPVGDKLETIFAKTGPRSSELEVLRYGWEITSIAAAAHAAQFLLLEIGPDNFILDSATQQLCLERATVCLPLESPAARERIGEMLVGLPGYMAPEQVTDASEIGTHTDVFGIGATLFRMLTGKPIYEGSSVSETLTQTRNAKVPDIAKLRKGISPKLAKLITDCLAKQTKQRPATAQELAVEIRGLLKHLGDKPLSALETYKMISLPKTFSADARLPERLCGHLDEVTVWLQTELDVASSADAQQTQILPQQRERVEIERKEREQQALERVRCDQEAQKKAEAERLELERLAQERTRQEQEKRERVERERAEIERKEREQQALERTRRDQEAQKKAEAERLELERLEQERTRQEQEKRERVERERAETERKEREQQALDRARRDQEAQKKAEAERLELERLEQERTRQEQEKRERVERERAETERKERERQVHDVKSKVNQQPTGGIENMAVQMPLPALKKAEPTEQKNFSVAEVLSRIQTVPAERYQIRRELNLGGQGACKVAFDQLAERDVVLKVSSPQSGWGAERLIKEARYAAKLNHSNVTRLLELGAFGKDQIFMTMPSIDGSSLDQVLQKISEAGIPGLTSYSITAVAELFDKVCAGLENAHANGLLHLDLKPQNIIVGSKGEVVVVDWGIAQLVNAPEMPRRYASSEQPAMPSLTTTLTGNLVTDGSLRAIGTPAYMSPEQWAGDPGTFTERTDVYGLGGVLFFLLTGQAPNQVQRATDLDPYFRHSPTPMPSDYTRRRVPPELEALCVKCLARNPQQRFPSAFHVRHVLKSWLSRPEMRELYSASNY